jgi:fibronectin type 3 domain-containing protein
MRILGAIITLLLVAVALMLGAAKEPVKVPVILSWNDAECGSCSFNIYRGVHGKPACVGVKNPVPFIKGLTETNYTDETPILGDGPYSYNVAAVDERGISRCATEVECTLSDKKCVIK